MTGGRAKRAGSKRGCAWARPWECRAKTCCRSKPWLEAVAASLTEMFAPLIVQQRLAAMLSHYPWVDPAGLQYFKNRLQQAPRDAEYALGLVTERFRTPHEQDRA